MANKNFWVCRYSKLISPGVATVTPLYVTDYFRTITAHPEVFYFFYIKCDTQGLMLNIYKTEDPLISELSNSDGFIKFL